MTLHERLLRLTLGARKAESLLGDLEEDAARTGASEGWVRRQAVQCAAVAALETLSKTRIRLMTTVRIACRDAWRSIVRFKVASSAAVVILAVSIAAATVTFAVVDTIVLRPLP